MDELRQWALCLIIGAAAGTFVMMISPRGSMDKTVRAVVGIFVVAAICSPLADLKETDFAFNAVADYEYDADDSSEDLREYMLDMCKKTADEHILSAAQEAGISVNKIFVNADINANNCIIIHEITVEIGAEHAGKSEVFSEALSKNLGVNVTVNAK